MQLQKTSAPAPYTKPQAPAPRLVTAPPERKHRGRWLVLAIVLIAGTAGLMWYRQAATDAAATTAAVSVIRSITVPAAVVDRTLRLTGTTAAEKFVSLTAPQMRGSRSDFGRGGPSSSFSRGGMSGGMSSGGRGSGMAMMGGGGGDSGGGGGGFSGRGGGDRGGGGGGGSSSSSASSSGAEQSSTVASTAGAASGASGSRSATAMRSATSRVSSGGGGSSGTSSSSRSSRGSGGGGTMGGQGLGSSASSLPGAGGFGGGGGPGGRGSGAFSLVLLEVAKPGSLVAKGDVVAEFDRESMLTRLDDYKASVIQSEASYRKMTAEIEVTRDSHAQTIRSADADLTKANLDLKTLPVRSEIDSERLKLTLEEAQARLNQLQSEVKYVEAGIQAELRIAELELEQTRVELRRAEANANRMMVKAPIEGLVVMQNTLRGTEFDQIKQGDQLFPGQGFMQIVDPSSMIINASVNQVDTEKLRIGQKARVRFDAFPDLQLPARIHSIGSVARSSRSRPDFVKEMAVVLKLEAMDPRVIPDLSVSADVILESSESGPAVPREALFTEAAGSGPARHYVYVKTAKGWERREVELGLSNFVRTAIRSGLKPGEVIALEQPQRPTNGNGPQAAAS